MAKTTCHNEIVSGMWKFRDTITPDELIKLAEEWKDGPDGNKYLDLHVRLCSKDQYGIGFMYVHEIEADKRHTYQSFFDRMTDLLKRKFGNAFVGWDVSSPTWMVK